MYSRVKRIFHAAVERSPADRAAFIDEACAGDEDLRREVESLLEYDGKAESFIECPAYFFGAAGRVEELAELPAGERIGAYRIVREIGRGGMGAVYLAVRDDDAYHKEVAVKLIRAGLETDAVVRRFRQERQILAALDHVNIARLLDGGTTGAGLPYLVMEYVEGVPITDYCDQHGLTTAARLRLFRAVCDAVQHAHQHLVVHRDLKPSNILITREGVPKLLDFGISKVLSPELSPQQTWTELRALTPDYASPEQVRGEQVTTAADVYSLGVVLYELLTGTRPYRATDASPHELARIVCEQEPVKPSESISEFGIRNSDSKTSHPQSTRNPKSLRGDLDNIILTALRKEPTRRYASAAQFSADLGRHLDGLPIAARKDTLRYRSGKFVRRNKATVAAATLVVISLIAGLGVSLKQARRADEQARIADARRVEAEEGRRSAERTSRFMQSFLEYANPNWYGRGKGRINATVREAIDNASARIDTELADDPEVRADLHYTVGEVYGTQGEHETSLKHFRQSLDLYRQVHGEHHPKVARGIYYVCVGMSRMGGARIEKLEPLLRQAVAMMRQTDRNNVNLPYMLQSLAQWIISSEKQSRNESRLAEAESLILEARSLFVSHYGGDHVATISADSSLALLALTRGDLAQAERIRQELVGRYQLAEGGTTAHTGALFSLAEIKLALGKVAEAETLFGQALEEGRREWGANDFRTERLAERIRKARTAAGR